MFNAGIINDDRQFAALESDWRQLLKRSGATVFQSWAWCWHWWLLNKKGKRLLIIAVKDKDRLIGLAPLFVSRFYVGLPLKVAALLGTGTIDYGGIIIDSEADRLRVLDSIKQLLFQQHWHVIDLHQLPEDDALVKGMELFEDQAVVYLVDQEPTLVTALPQSIDDFRLSLSKKFRTNLDYNWRRLQRDHRVEIKISAPESVLEDMSGFFDLHRKRWRQRRLPGAFYTAGIRELHRAIATQLAAEGSLQLSFLLVDGEEAAAVYGFKQRDVFYYYLGGFDPRWGSRSVSSLLLYNLVTEAIKKGLRSFDFLRGAEDYKNRWQAELKQNYRLIIARASVKSSLAKSLLIAENAVVLKAKAWLHQQI